MTELIWEGKYDKDGRKVAPLRVALPFQTVETINESARERNYALDMFTSGRPAEWRNRLIWGDKKYVLPSLLEEYAGKVNLIYIDPPFDTGADFSFQVQVNGEGFTKEPSVIEQKAYRDTWGKGLDSYVQWFFETVTSLRELLAEDGSIYVHLDWHVGHYAKVILDEVFGKSNFRNEIVWQNANSKNYTSSTYSAIHNLIYFYTKSDDYVLNERFEDLDPEYAERAYRHQESDGRRYRLLPLHAPGVRFGPTGNPWKGMRPLTDSHWRFAPQTMDDMDRNGLIVLSKTGVPAYKKYLDTSQGTRVGTLWLDAKQLPPSENTDYPTQKPEKIMDRIVSASSSEGDLVLDCFVGSGTTVAVAEKLNRRWIACDLGRFAIHTTRKRLLSIPNVKPFVVQNLGKYERQLWQAAEFGEHAEQRTLAYRRFILELYHAQPVTGYSWLHGVKAGRMVHIGAVDSPISPGDVAQIASEFKRAVGTGKDAPKTNGVDVLGWDFAFEINEVAKQQAAQANINMRFLRIPREVLEKKAVDQGDIRFFELAALSIDMAQKGRAVSLTLTDFVIPPDDVPEEVRKVITHWEQWVDYWAVDWNNRSDTFHNEWQDYRTRKKRDLQKSVSHTYEEPGAYVVVVKVIDILGNDTTKTLKVEVV